MRAHHGEIWYSNKLFLLIQLTKGQSSRAVTGLSSREKNTNDSSAMEFPEASQVYYTV